MNNNTSNENRQIFHYIGHHPEYGKHKCCHVCGTASDISGTIVFAGQPGTVWAGEHFTFPVCATCFYEALGTLMERMDEVVHRREIEREKEREKYLEEYDPLYW